MTKYKHIPESSKIIPKHIGKLIKDEKMSVLDKEDNPKDLVDIMNLTNRAYNSGNNNISRDYNPEEIISDYASLDE